VDLAEHASPALDILCKNHIFHFTHHALQNNFPQTRKIMVTISLVQLNDTNYSGGKKLAVCDLKQV